MLELKGFKGMKKIPWKDLEPGMIYLGGIKVAQNEIDELKNYPVLTPELIVQLKSKYHFLNEKFVLVAESNLESSPFTLQDDIQKKEKSVVTFNEFRNLYTNDKKNLIQKHGLLIQPDESLLNTKVVEQDYLIKDKYNSFFVPIQSNPAEIPSFLNRLDMNLTLADILSGRLKEKFNLPSDKKVYLHLVVDLSFSMDAMNKLEYVLSSVHSFYKYISEFFLNTKIKLYVFSNQCALVKFPISGREITREDTYYTSFMKKILYNRENDVYNKVVLFTDGQPTDLEDSIQLASQFKTNKIDFTQIVFFVNEDIRYEVDNVPSGISRDGCLTEEKLPKGAVKRTLSDTELEVKKKEYLNSFTRFAEAAGGNQIIISLYDFINLIAVECYDKYVGSITLADINQIQQLKSESKQESIKNVKKMDFKKLR